MNHPAELSQDSPLSFCFLLSLSQRSWVTRL